MAKIIIIGGHGKVALIAERLLSDLGHDVSAIIRNPAQAADVHEAGATPVVADIEHLDVDALAQLFAGHDAIVWSAGAGGGAPQRTYAVDRDAAIRSMQAAAQAGVSRYVMVSYLGSSKDHGVDPGDSFFAYAEAKAAADEYLRSTALRWTILGPSTLTLEPGTGKIEVSPTSTRSVPRADVAAVVAASLEDDSTIGRTIGFNTGQVPIAEAISGRRQPRP